MRASSPNSARSWLTRAVTVVAVAALACSSPARRELSSLVLQDSTYFEPETMLPFTGEVVKYFDEDPDRLQLRGHLRDGTWNGELTVWHPNGRIRYMGDLADGEKCGAWTENQDPDPPGDVADQIRQEIASLGLYPPCPDR